MESKKKQPDIAEYRGWYVCRYFPYRPNREEDERELYQYSQSYGLSIKVKAVYGANLDEEQFKEKLLYLYSIDSSIPPHMLPKDKLENIIDRHIRRCNLKNGKFNIDWFTEDVSKIAGFLDYWLNY